MSQPQQQKPAQPAPLDALKTKIVIVFPRVQCPTCLSYYVRTTGVDWPLRFHNCSSCGVTFQSHDRGPNPKAIGKAG